MPRLMLATAKTGDGAFVVDALGTDGGGIPRNVLLEDGLLLVQMELITLPELSYPGPPPGCSDCRARGISAWAPTPT